MDCIITAWILNLDPKENKMKRRDILEFSLLEKICINDEKLVHLFGSIISKFFLSHLAVRGANLFQATLTIANVKVFFIWSWFISSHCKKCSWRKFSLLKFFYRQQIFPNLFTIFTILFLRWHPPSQLLNKKLHVTKRYWNVKDLR